jgi:antitoxin (DNA-binding transcriptional repressor) of toxin-antitoxin stability system
MKLKEATMRQIPDLEAQADFDRLLEDVERGESILITRNGRTIARIHPEMPSPIPPESTLAENSTEPGTR